MLKIGDVVTVIKNNFPENWNFLVGKTGTVVAVCTPLVYNGENGYEVQFDHDEYWADTNYICLESELKYQ